MVNNKKLNNLSKLLLLIVSLLLGYGLIVLSSASTVESIQNFGNTYKYIFSQVTKGVLLGLISLYIFRKIDYHIFKKFLPIILVVSLALLLAVKIPGIGFTVGGSSRWVHFGAFVFQPSELAKLAIVIYLAAWTDKRKNEINDFTNSLLPAICIIAIYAGLIIWQPDFGTMLVLILISASMLFVSGINYKYIAWSTLGGLIALYSLIKAAPYRLKRLEVFLNPDLDPRGIGYHISQALLAIGSGGIFGYGYGLSRQKHNYLPEVMSDSIFAILSEELGFAGVCVAILLFILLFITGYKIAKNAPDTFGRMLAFGITSWFAFQILVNISAMTALIPLTGVPLPFFSYGSTAMILNLTSIGILLNISGQST